MQTKRTPKKAKSPAARKSTARNSRNYKNPRLPVKARVADLLKRMTIEEKVAQMLCLWRGRQERIFDETGQLNHDLIKKNLKNGMGQIARLTDLNNGLKAEQIIALANVLQKFFVEETRLGIPVIFHEEALHGLPAIDTVSYPQPIALASSFDPQLIEDIYTTVAEDLRSRGAHQALTPVVDVARDPRWGRVEETFGEDPHLVAQLGMAAVRGFQGDGTFRNKTRVLATLKHFAAHSQPESGSNCGPGNYSERVLRDIFFHSFREVVKKCKPASVMASYNEIDGLPSHANQWLLRKVLRQEWGFEGYVVSDYFAITELYHKGDSVSHGLARDKKEAALLALLAGVNIELPDTDCYPFIRDLIKEKRIKESVLDELIAPMLKYKFMMGLFEDPYVQIDAHRAAEKMQADKKLALRAAQESIVLLKNDRALLPLNPQKYRRIAVIGPNADRRMLGGYSGKPPEYTTVLQGIKDKAGSQCQILYSEGCKITVNGSWEEDVVTLPDPRANRKAIKEAVSTAKKSDLVILVLGGNEQTSREAWSKVHLGDRASLDLFGDQNELARAVIATGRPVVLLLFNGRPLSIVRLKDQIPAIVECWYLGQESGAAVADVLFGGYNPGGKLPISFPRSAGHLPCFYNHKPSARRGYLFDDITPLFPFGYGLSYTRFVLNNLRLKKPAVRRDETARVFIDVTNSGDRPGEEVVQMYIRDLHSSVTRPVKELRGFKRVRLEPGESKTIELAIEPEHLAFTDVNLDYTVEPGDFEIMVGNSSRDQDLSKVILTVK